MDDQKPPKLQSLKQVKARNFWNTCPRKLEYLPDSPCEMGKCSVEIRDESKQPCSWSVNSPEANYCFWKLIQDRSTQDGQMLPFFQGEIAKQLKCSPTKIHFLVKQAIQNLKDSNHLPALQRVLEGSEGSPEDSSTEAETLRLVNEIEEQNALEREGPASSGDYTGGRDFYGNYGGED